MRKDQKIIVAVVILVLVEFFTLPLFLLSGNYTESSIVEFLDSKDSFVVLLAVFLQFSVPFLLGFWGLVLSKEKLKLSDKIIYSLGLLLAPVTIFVLSKVAG